MQIENNTFCCKKCKKPLRDSKYEYCALCRTEIAEKRKKDGGILTIVSILSSLALFLVGCRKK